jgi:hypothetical protein
MQPAVLRTLLAAALLALAAASPVGAQRAAPPLSALRAGAPLPAAAPAYVPALPQEGGRIDPVSLAFGGIAGGALGAIGGGAAGYFMETAVFQCRSEEFCGLGGLLLGAAVGEAVLLPYGVHQANRSRGRYASALATSVIIGVVGLAAASQAGEAAPTVLLAIPAAQLLAAVATERDTERRRRRD